MARGRGMLLLLAFQFLNEYWRLERKPPVKAALLAVNTLFHLRMPASHDRILPYIDQVWFNPYLFLKPKELKHFLLSAFNHIDESHFVYNMVSLLWKGIRLETSMGSFEFAQMVTILLGLSHGITLLLAKALFHFFDYGSPYYQEDAVGFLGILFAMKVFFNTQQSMDSYTDIHREILPVLIRYAAGQKFFGSNHLYRKLLFLVTLVVYWQELSISNLKLLQHFFKKKRIRFTDGPIFFCVLLMDVSFPLDFVGIQFFDDEAPLALGKGDCWWCGESHERRNNGRWSCQTCTFDNSGLLNVCEMCCTGRSNDDEEDGGLASNRSSDYFSSDILWRSCTKGESNDSLVVMV